jgi:hypothetical protein
MAYEAVGSFWIETRIWNPEWGHLPGMKWRHMELFPDLDEEDSLNIPNAISTPRSVTGNGNRPSAPSSGTSNATSAPGVDHDRTNLNHVLSVAGGDEASSRVTSGPTPRKKTSKSVNNLHSAPDGHTPAKKTAHRALRSVRSSRVEKPSKPKSTGRPRRREESGRSTVSMDASRRTGQNGTSINPPNSDANPRLSESRSRPSRQAKAISRNKQHVTFNDSSITHLDPAQPNRSQALSQPPAAYRKLRRSPRIAKRLQARGGPERISKAGTPKCQHNAVATTSVHVEEHARQKRRKS